MNKGIRSVEVAVVNTAMVNFNIVTANLGANGSVWIQGEEPIIAESFNPYMQVTFGAYTSDSNGAVSAEIIFNGAAAPVVLSFSIDAQNKAICDCPSAGGIKVSMTENGNGNTLHQQFNVQFKE